MPQSNALHPSFHRVVPRKSEPGWAGLHCGIVESQHLCVDPLTLGPVNVFSVLTEHLVWFFFFSSVYEFLVLHLSYR